MSADTDTAVKPDSLGYELSDTLYGCVGDLFHGISPVNVLHARETGARNYRRGETQLRSTYKIVQPWLLRPTVFHSAQRNVDKAFAAAWVSEDSVLVCTKCNSLLRLNVLTGAWCKIALPPKPAVRLGPDLMYNPDGNFGSHAVDVSPGWRYVVTGGRAAEDAVVLWADTLRPVQTFSSHADWIFGLAWVTDQHFVSCSRDGTIKLWSVKEPGDRSYNPEPAGPDASVLHNKRQFVKQRDVKCWVPSGRITSLGTDGCVATWDTSLRQCRKVMLEGAKELICLAVQEHLVVAGSGSHMHLLDMRQRCTNVGTVPVTDNGVRSLQLAGPVLSVGTGDANVVFFDLRYLRHAKGRKLKDLSVEDDPFEAVVGHQPNEVGHLEMPSSGYNTFNQWGWEIRDTVYSHCWDATGTRLFMAGGPLSVGLSGCSLSVWM